MQQKEALEPYFGQMGDWTTILPRLVSHKDSPTRYLGDVPGIKEVNRGFRVPHNCRPLLNPHYKPRKATPQQFTDAMRRMEKLRVLDDGDGMAKYLMRHQRSGIRRAMPHPFFAIWDDAGGGKSLPGLMLMLMAGPPYLIVTTNSLRPSWRSRCNQMTRQTFQPLFGTHSHRIKPKKDEIYFIHKAILPYWETMLGEHRWSILVDEAHMFRDTRRSVFLGAGRYRSVIGQAASLSRLSQRARNRVTLTGSPWNGNATDLWSQLDIGQPWGWGSFTDFRARYSKQETIEAADGRPVKVWTGTRRGRELKERVKTIRVRRQIGSIMDMPELRVSFPCLSGEDVNRGFGRSNATDLKEAAKAGNLYQYYRLLCAGMKRDWTVEDALERLRTGSKLLVLTGRHIDVERLGDKLRKSKLPRNTRLCAFHGGNSTAEERFAEIEVQKNHDGPTVYIATSDTVGVGLDFQWCNSAIFNMFPGNPGKMRQILARLLRIGLEHKSIELVLPYIQGSIEEAVFTKLFAGVASSRALTPDSFLADLESRYDETTEDDILSIFA